jgi:hypothetical protein
MKDIVVLDCLSQVVAKNDERQLVGVGEGFVREWVIHAYANYLRSKLHKRLHRVTKDAHFPRADIRKGAREESEHGFLSLEVL